MEDAGGRFGAGGQTKSNTFYFDVEADKELTFNEYIERLNINFDKVMQQFINNKGQDWYSNYKMYHPEPPIDQEVIFSENYFIAAYEDWAGFGDISVKVNTPIAEIMNWCHPFTPSSLKCGLSICA